MYLFTTHRQRTNGVCSVSRLDTYPIAAVQLVNIHALIPLSLPAKQRRGEHQ